MIELQNHLNLKFIFCQDGLNFSNSLVREAKQLFD